MKRPGLRAAALAALIAGCAPPPGPAGAPPGGAPAHAVEDPPAAAIAAPPPDPAGDPTRAAQEEVRRMLARASKTRGLPVRRDVPGRVLDRAEILARIREHVAREIPPDVLTYQGEILAALQLIPAEYDFTEGMYRLLEGRIAGFYEPADGTMYLVDDLDESEAAETLAHELVHALQDQSYPLKPLLEYVPGDSDRLAAVHALIEGDATAGMLDIIAGSAFHIDESVLRKLVAMSTALSSVGDTPRVLQESLGAPYTDGFALVQGLRRQGGWAAVDAVWRAPPQTTEQLLHLDKLAAREPAIPVAPPDVTPLGEGFGAVFDDVMGEQGLRIVFTDLAPRDVAAAAAAGWGGDRLVLARKDVGVSQAAAAVGAAVAGGSGGGARQYALAWRMRFDTAADAREAAKLLEGRFGKACKARDDLGPVAWALRGSDIALVAGPYERAGRRARSTGTCATSRAWLEAVIKAPVGGLKAGDAAAPARP
ncbi:MAG: hypothetical protein IT372_37250 [Polyangiaceae bacterium]|nr:hypothetical protein [Polyangiaceae bacterium]